MLGKIALQARSCGQLPSLLSWIQAADIGVSTPSVYNYLNSCAKNSVAASPAKEKKTGGKFLLTVWQEKVIQGYIVLRCERRRTNSYSTTQVGQVELACGLW